MVVNSKSDQKSSSVLQIKQDDKFFCRLLSKETSMSNPSFRVASSSSVAVPFVWESQPGTPKHTFSDNTLPPLTPPPSYYHFKNNNACKNHPQEKLKKLRPSSSSSSSSSPKSNIFMALLPKLNLKKMMILSTPKSKSKSNLSSPTPSSLSCSSSHSSRVVPMAKIGMRRFLSYGSSSFDFRGDHHHHHHHHHNNNEDDNSGGGGSGSPSSTLCFGLPRSTSSNSGFLSIYKRQA